MFAFVFECFETWLPIYVDGFAVTLRRFAAEIPAGRGHADIFVVCSRIDNADGEGRRIAGVPFVIIAMHHCPFEPAHIYSRTLGFARAPSGRRSRQERKE